MSNMPPFLLICGTSHVGKSTLARTISDALGWQVFSSDKMARHPGRPWETDRPHVAEFYTQLSDKTIYTLLQHHHQGMWPGIRCFIENQCAVGQPFILEGSALRPAKLRSYAPNTLCLIADPDVLRQRMMDNSRYDQQTDAARQHIDAFIARTLTDNAAVRREARENEIRYIDVTTPDAITAYQQSFITAQLNARQTK